MAEVTWIPASIQDQSRMTAWILPDNGHEGVADPSNLAILVDSFDPIILEEMDAVALLNRIDTKFVMPIGQLSGVLAGLCNDYRILSAGGQRLNRYRTLYFDLPDFELYRLHVNGNGDYYKVRSRQYTDSGLSFLEVKHKTNKGRTIKDRILTHCMVTHLDRGSENWLGGVFPYKSRGLEPKLWNTFTRITLVGKRFDERVTLDMNLAFFTASKAVYVNGIVIAEVKRNAENTSSPFQARMRSERLRAQGFSKYCLGITLLYDQVKKNSMKPKLLWIEKMTGGFASYD
jgi:hypothetical protein